MRSDLLVVSLSLALPASSLLAQDLASAWKNSDPSLYTGEISISGGAVADDFLMGNNTGPFSRMVVHFLAFPGDIEGTEFRWEILLDSAGSPGEVAVETGWPDGPRPVRGTSRGTASLVRERPDVPPAASAPAGVMGEYRVELVLGTPENGVAPIPGPHWISLSAGATPSGTAIAWLTGDDGNGAEMAPPQVLEGADWVPAPGNAGNDLVFELFKVPVPVPDFPLVDPGPSPNYIPPQPGEWRVAQSDVIAEAAATAETTGAVAQLADAWNGLDFLERVASSLGQDFVSLGDGWFWATGGDYFYLENSTFWNDTAGIWSYAEIGDAGVYFYDFGRGAWIWRSGDGVGAVEF